MYAAPPVAIVPYGRTGGRGLSAGVAVPAPVPANMLTRPTPIAAPVPEGEDVYAARLRYARAGGAALDARRADAAAAQLAPFIAADDAVREARTLRLQGNALRADRLEQRLWDAAIPKTDERVAAERQAAADRQTAIERGRLQAAVRGRNVVPIADRASQTVHVVDGASAPGVALQLARRQASSTREPAGLPAYLEAALAPTPEMADDAAALGTGEPSPQVAILREIRGDARGLSGVALDPALAALVPSRTLGTVVVLGLVAWLLLAVRR